MAKYNISTPEKIETTSIYMRYNRGIFFAGTYILPVSLFLVFYRLQVHASFRSRLSRALDVSNSMKTTPALLSWFNV